MLWPKRPPTPPLLALAERGSLVPQYGASEGEHGGVKVLIVDATLSMGGKRGRYSTFVATRTDENLFRLRTEPEKIAQSNGWTALYRLRFWQTPWTLSIRRIEEHLASLSG
jgi:hypothetical protein